MKVNWVVSNNIILDPAVDIDTLKDVGSFWGSWKSWRSCQTDNVICNDLGKAKDLVQRDFQKLCNFYIPSVNFVLLDRPIGVRLYEGQYQQDIDNAEEIITMHLAASQSDIILLLGFDWSERPKNPDKLLEHNAHVYRHLVKHAIEENASVQWVLLDHQPNIMPELSKLPNLTKDTLSNVLGMLSP